MYEVGEYFEVKMGVEQVCVLSLWLFSVFYNRVVRRANEKATGEGLKLKDDSRRG